LRRISAIRVASANEPRVSTRLGRLGRGADTAGPFGIEAIVADQTSRRTAVESTRGSPAAAIWDGWPGQCEVSSR